MSVFNSTNRNNFVLNEALCIYYGFKCLEYPISLKIIINMRYTAVQNNLHVLHND